MLDAKDLQAIRGVVREEIKEEGRIIEKNIMSAVGEMLEESILPQLEVINRRLDNHDKLLGWQQ